jgi:glycosyltransferase involved in cell wall biosynthesis
MSVTDERLDRLGLTRVISAMLGLRLLLDVLIAGLLTEQTVWTAHNLRSHRDVAPRTERLLKHIFVRAVCDAVIVHCGHARERLIETFDLPATARDRIHIVPHGHFRSAYNSPISAESARTELDLPADGPVILFFGWIREYKQVPELLKAFARLDRADARLLVVGKPATDRLNAKISRLAESDSRVQTRLEFIPDEDVHRYFSAADVVTAPFDTTDQSLLTSGSVVLAMGFGRPVVAPTLGCVSELLSAAPASVWATGEPVGDGPGEAAPPQHPSVNPMVNMDGDCEPWTPTGEQEVSAVPGGVLYNQTSQLNLALERVLAADLERMGERNRQYVAELSWDRIAARTLALYRG